MANTFATSTAKHIPYPDTPDFKATKGTFLKKLKKQRNAKHSRVTFFGTVKIHGTNITIVFAPSTPPQIQTRNKVINKEEDDGYRSAEWLTPRIEVIRSAFKPIIPTTMQVVIAGELAGRGINPNQAATSELKKFFTIFRVRVDGIWLDRKVWQHVRFPPETSIFNIYEFRTFEVEIDFNEERTIGGGKIIVDLSFGVENECPVALQLGGIKKGLGEGIVWIEERDECSFPKEVLFFKSKGPRFATSGKVPPSEVGEINNKAEAFVKYAVTEARLEQGLERIREQLGRGRAQDATLDEVFRDNSNINKLSYWLAKDIMKEEANEMLNLGLDKGVGKQSMLQIVMRTAKEAFLRHQQK